MDIKLNQAAEQQAIASIQRYCSAQLDQEIGQLQASLMLQFFLQEIGPSVYNQALSDAQAYIQDKAADMEINCAVSEFPYWPPAAKAKRKG